MKNFRRILPCPDDPDKYNQYFLLQNQASVYCDTAASKRREECVKQQRKEFAEKVNFNQQMMSNNRIKLQSLKPIDDSFFRKKIKKKKEEEVDLFQPEFILESDERDRIAYMLERTFLMKSCGLLQNIIASFYRYNLLTPSDHRKYKDVFTKIKAESVGQQVASYNPYKEKRVPLIKITLVYYNISFLSFQLKLKDIISNVTMGMTCSEAPINSLPLIPYEKSENR